MGEHCSVASTKGARVEVEVVVVVVVGVVEVVVVVVVGVVVVVVVVVGVVVVVVVCGGVVVVVLVMVVVVTSEHSAQSTNLGPSEACTTGLSSARLTRKPPRRLVEQPGTTDVSSITLAVVSAMSEYAAAAWQSGLELIRQ